MIQIDCSHGNQLFAEIEIKCTMNLGLVGFHEEMENLGVWPPILLLAVAVAAWSTSAQNGRDWPQQGWDPAQQRQKLAAAASAEPVVNLYAMMEQASTASSVPAAFHRAVCLLCRLSDAGNQQPAADPWPVDLAPCSTSMWRRTGRDGGRADGEEGDGVVGGENQAEAREKLTSAGRW
jgi:hypothetical protein